MVARRPRSPKYPQFSLREAIGRVNKVLSANHTYKVEKESVATALGYGSLNGASVSIIGTLKSYGLLQEDKEGVQVTEDAITLLRAPEGDPDRAQALQRAAFAPKVFADLHEAYGEVPTELPIETTLQYRLERKGFLEKAASEIIRTYRDNLEFVSAEATEYTAGELVDEQPVEAQMQAQTRVDAPHAPQHHGRGSLAPTATPPHATPSSIMDGPFTESLEIRISADSKVRLLFDGMVTKEAIGKLRKYLELAEDDYPSRAEIEQRAVEQPAEQPAIEPPASESR